MVIWLCSVFRILFIYFLISSAYIIFLKSPISEFDKTYLKADAFVLFVVLFVYSFQIVILSLLVGQIFKKSKHNLI